MVQGVVDLPYGEVDFGGEGVGARLAQIGVQGVRDVTAVLGEQGAQPGELLLAPGERLGAATGGGGVEAGDEVFDVGHEGSPARGCPAGVEREVERGAVGGKSAAVACGRHSVAGQAGCVADPGGAPPGVVTRGVHPDRGLVRSPASSASAAGVNNCRASDTDSRPTTRAMQMSAASAGATEAGVPASVNRPVSSRGADLR